MIILAIMGFGAFALTGGALITFAVRELPAGHGPAG